MEHDDKPKETEQSSHDSNGVAAYNEGRSQVAPMEDNQTQKKKTGAQKFKQKVHPNAKASNNETKGKQVATYPTAKPLIILVDMDNTLSSYNEAAVRRYEAVYKPKKQR